MVKKIFCFVPGKDLVPEPSGQDEAAAGVGDGAHPDLIDAADAAAALRDPALAAAGRPRRPGRRQPPRHLLRLPPPLLPQSEQTKLEGKEQLVKSLDVMVTAKDGNIDVTYRLVLIQKKKKAKDNRQLDICQNVNLHSDKKK